VGMGKSGLGNLLFNCEWERYESEYGGGGVHPVARQYGTSKTSSDIKRSRAGHQTGDLKVDVKGSSWDKVLGEDVVEYGDEKSKLLLCEETAVLMKKCFHLLGITPIIESSNYRKEKESETTSAAKVPFKEKHTIDARVENGDRYNELRWAPPNVSVPLLNLVDKVFQLNRWCWLRTLTKGYDGADEARMLQSHFNGTFVKIGVGAYRAAAAAFFSSQT
ncbi:hypothetical protein Tco_0204163, partial [Tanacetum coccineum]